MFDPNKDPGVGSLNLRAYVASVVGPKRAAFGQRSIRLVPPTQSAELAQNVAPNDQVDYVEVWIPNQLLAAGLRILFSSSESMGETAELVALGVFVDNKVLDRYRTILLPKDQLYAQVISDLAGAPITDPVPVVVSKVTF